MAEFNLETVIKSGVEKALNKPIADGKSITEWAAIGMKAPHWISVKERMPERGNTCLVWLRGGGMTFMVFDGSRFVGGSAYSGDRITHWMLLPGAPEEVGGDG